jgi:hypothetical protein
LPYSLWKRLEFASLIAYSPRPDEVAEPRRAEARLSRNLVLALKDGRLFGTPPESVASRIVRHLRSVPASARTFTGFLTGSPTLVPVPRSTLLTKGALWVPEQLAQELVKGGFGGSVSALLERSAPIPKAATSLSTDRPTAQANYDTLRVSRSVEAHAAFLLVDDVVTAGATLLGSASRLAEAYPGVPIKGFAAARTVSVADRFRQSVDPVVGEILLRSNGRTQRDP